MTKHTRRLTKSQREQVIEWVGEGLGTPEINKRAAVFEPPFDVDRRLVDYYRRRHKVDLKALSREGELSALVTGLAVKANRVELLKTLAEMMTTDLVSGGLWLTDVKGVLGEVVEYEKFNSDELEQLRRTLDDIAKEIGDRNVKVDHSIAPVQVVLSVPKNGRARPGVEEWAE